MTSIKSLYIVIGMINDATSNFWQKFLSSKAGQKFESPRLYEAFSIGTGKEDADSGARLILDGLKTATSAHPSEFDVDSGPPFPGALSILLDGSGKPVAVLETLEVNLRKLDQLDEDFARDYGEWDRTLETLQSKLAAYYEPFVQSRDDSGVGDLKLLCERFQIVLRAD